MCNAAGGGTWPCGIEATRALRYTIAGHDVSCHPVTLDRYGRTVARCFVGTNDIQAHMVRQGLAWAFVKYSTDYVPEETEARAALRGIWQADTQTAWDFRATRWAEYDKAAPEGCPIKGTSTATASTSTTCPGAAITRRSRWTLRRARCGFARKARRRRQVGVPPDKPVFAEIRDGAPRKPPQLRCLCRGLANRRSGLELRQPQAQFGPILGRKLRNGLLDVF